MGATVIKLLPDGRLSLDIRKLGTLLNEAVMGRIMTEENPVVKALLEELRAKLCSCPARVKLRRSEWLALMDADTLAYLDEYEMAYLVSVLLERKKGAKTPVVIPQQALSFYLDAPWYLQ